MEDSFCWCCGAKLTDDDFDVCADRMWCVDRARAAAVANQLDDAAEQAGTETEPTS